MKEGYNDFNPQGFISDKVPKDIFDFIKDECIVAKQNQLSYSNQLAGNLEESYLFQFHDTNIKEKFEKYIIHLIEFYQKRYHYPKNLNILNTNLPYSLSNLWVNYQKKYEFNPIHSHPGVFGFVIWIKIPYQLEDEFNYVSVKNSKNKLSSIFQFQYNDIFGLQSHNLYVDKEFEGKIILFPAFMKHLVYPFYTSDEYRISVAGNVILKVPEKNIENTLT